jgi:hypothetical protein
MFLRIAKFFIEKFMNTAEMPEEMKNFLKDDNNNVIPDILEDGNLEKHIKEIRIGDKTYNSSAEVPQEHKKFANLGDFLSSKTKNLSENQGFSKPPQQTPERPPGPDIPKSINNNSRLFVLIPIIIVVGILIYYSSNNV